VLSVMLGHELVLVPAEGLPLQVVNRFVHDPGDDLLEWQP